MRLRASSKLLVTVGVVSAIHGAHGAPDIRLDIICKKRGRAVTKACIHSARMSASCGRFNTSARHRGHQWITIRSEETVPHNIGRAGVGSERRLKAEVGLIVENVATVI
jgi:hypothetical protein